jgi:hypothetical protein
MIVLFRCLATFYHFQHFCLVQRVFSSFSKRFHGKKLVVKQASAITELSVLWHAKDGPLGKTFILNLPFLIRLTI